MRSFKKALPPLKKQSAFRVPRWMRRGAVDVGTPLAGAGLLAGGGYAAGVDSPIDLAALGLLGAAGGTRGARHAYRGGTPGEALRQARRGEFDTPLWREGFDYQDPSAGVTRRLRPDAPLEEIEATLGPLASRQSGRAITLGAGGKAGIGALFPAGRAITGASELFEEAGSDIEELARKYQKEGVPLKLDVSEDSRLGEFGESVKSLKEEGVPVRHSFPGVVEGVKRYGPWVLGGLGAAGLLYWLLNRRRDED